MTKRHLLANCFGRLFAENKRLGEKREMRPECFCVFIVVINDTFRTRVQTRTFFSWGKTHSVQMNGSVILPAKKQIEHLFVVLC